MCSVKWLENSSFDDESSLIPIRPIDKHSNV